jgi:hypothetical protein
MDFRMPQAIYYKLYLRDSGIEPSLFNKQGCLAKPNELAPTLATGLSQSTVTRGRPNNKGHGCTHVVISSDPNTDCQID